MRLLLAFCLLLFTQTCFAQETTEVSRKSITIDKVSSPPIIDGKLNDKAWENAAIATNFIERMPNNGVPIPDSLHTEVKIVYDDLGIYFGAKMFDPSPEEIKKELTERDVIGNDDFFFVGLNGYNDRQQSLQFIVTAAGVQYDARATNTMEDVSWNAVWFSDVQITDFGWVAEIFIPYSELRFPDKKVQEWGLNMEREVRRSRTRYSWSHVDNTKGSFSYYDGVIYGIEDIDTPVRLSLLPYVSTYLNNYDGETDVNFNGGMDLKYGLSDAFTLDMILIPDFGQAKFDETVLNLSAFEVQYAEQRAFFTEGTELFNKGNLFYSRRIGSAPIGVVSLNEDEELVNQPSSVDLINAIKVSGRTNKGLGVGFLNAITDRSFATVHNSSLGTSRDVLVEPYSNYNLLVLDQRFGNNSSVAMVNTNTIREGSFRDANATGLYMDLTNKANTWNYFASAEGSWVFEEDTKFGTEIQAGVAETSGNYTYKAQVDLRSKDYDINALGFSTTTNYIEYSANYRYRILQPTNWFNNMNLNLNLSHFRRLDPDLYGNFIVNLNSFFTTRNFHTFGGGFETTPFGTQDFYEPRVAERFVKIPAYYDQWIFISTDYRKRFAVDATIDWYKYDERGRGKLLLDFSPRFRFSDKFNVIYGTNVSLSDKEEGFADIVADEIIFGQRDRTTVINSLSSQFIFNNKTAVNLAFRHYFSEVFYDKMLTLEEDGELSFLAESNGDYDTTYNSWNLDLRFSWWFAPGSQMTILYRHAIDSYVEDAPRDLSTNFDDLFNQPQLNNLSLRINYYLDYSRTKNWFLQRSST